MSIKNPDAATAAPPPTTPTETLADDGPFTPAQQALLDQFEPFARQLLALLGQSYDELIRLDGRSAYAQAINADPGLSQRVAQSPNPVLAALTAALQFKPFADFMNQYGNTPEAIKASLWEEFSRTANQPQTTTPAVATPTTAVFSRTTVLPPVPTRTSKAPADLSAFIKR